MFGGVKKTTDFLDKGTWVLAIVLVGLVLSMNVMVSPRSAADSGEELQSEISEQMLENPVVAPQGSGVAPIQVDPDMESEPEAE